MFTVFLYLSSLNILAGYFLNNECLPKVYRIYYKLSFEKKKKNSKKMKKLNSCGDNNGF